MKKRFLFVYLLLISTYNYGQLGVKFNNYGINEGLSYSLVTSIVRDDKGFLWIATQNGLNKFDGYRFKHFYADKTRKTPAKNHISNLFKDSHGYIWIYYFKEGIGRLDPKTGLFTSYIYDPGTEGSFPNEYLFTDDIRQSDQNIFFEDSNSDVWISSENGLIYYQRKTGKFSSFTFEERNTSSLSDNYIRSISEDKYGNIWIGTKDGLNLINNRSKQVKRVFTTQVIPELSEKPVISKIFFHSDGSLWLGTINMGLFIIHNPYDDQIKYTQYNDQFLKEKGELNIYGIYKTLSENILIASSTGLYNVSYSDKKIQTNKTTKLLNSITSFIVEDDNGYIWAGGDPRLIDTHIYRFDQDLNDFQIYGNRIKSINDYGGKPISFIQKGKNGLIFVGTIKDGFYIIDTNAKKFGLINSNTSEGSFLTNNNVYSIFEDSKNNLWIGTAQGLYLKNLKTGYTRNFKNNQIGRSNINYNYSKKLESKLIGSINETKDGKIWLGSFDYKVSLYDPKKDSFINFHHNPKDPKSFTGWSIRSICITRSGETYIGGTSMGLCKVNQKDLSFTYYKANPGNGPSDPWISIITEGKDGFLWLGTFEGLDRFDPKTETFKFFSLIPDDISHSKVNVRTILEPRIKNVDFLWIGSDRGLFKFNKRTGNIEHFTMKDGLPNDTILGILEDDEGFLWLSTLNGLAKVDPDSLKIINYTIDDGLQSNEFNEGAYFKNKEGVMYFGGVNGITFFKPEEIVLNQKANKIVLTDLKINQRSVNVQDTINGRIVLDKSISYIQELTLTHSDRLVSFEFATTNLVSPADIRYRYKLAGHEKNWNEVSQDQRFANYSDLKSGKYELLIEASNSDGMWSNDPLRLKISILPYLWERFWFKFGLALFLLTVTGGYFQWRNYNLKKQKKLLEKEVKERTADLKKANEVLEQKNTEISIMSQKIHELDLMKLRFFTNISHEFRTPLTLIHGPVEKLINLKDYKNTGNIKDNLNIIQRNSKRLSKLINQLLELPKIDSDSLKLMVAKGDLIKYSNEILNLFRNYAGSKNINLKFLSDTQSLEVYFDSDKIEKILYNLLSNAINYTPEGGTVSLKISRSEYKGSKEMICICVKDTGKGIPKEEIAHVFDRFYRIEKSNKSGNISTGIGLSLVKSLIDIYRGHIDVKSAINKGTEFRVYLPVNKDHFKPKEINNNIETGPMYNYSKSMLALSVKDEKEDLQQGELKGDKNIRIVIVEDNNDLRKFLFNELGDLYQIYTASNGKEGLELIRKHMPNIVISDIMMPEMDGIEMCRLVKNDLNTSHISVFLLTAKSEEEHQLEGLNVGADDYITKPFNIETLKLRIINAVKTRKAIIEKFANDTNPIPEGIEISTLDHNLLEKIVSFVEKNIDTEITGDILAAELGLSKSNLYKKLKDLTGFSVNIYIRNIRLKIAAQILTKGNYSISDVAYAVGFNNPKYFSSCFMKLYGVSPKNFRSDETSFTTNKT